MTAAAVSDAQKNRFTNGEHRTVPVVPLEMLREQDFGSLECTHWANNRAAFTDDSPPNPEVAGFKPKETAAAMEKRTNGFLDDYIVPLLATDQEEENVVIIVSHGLILSVLWKALLARFGQRTISLSAEAGATNGLRGLDTLPHWANTGYLELEIEPYIPELARTTPSTESAASAQSPLYRNAGVLVDWKMTVRAINCRDHLNNLKRTGGGVGSATYDARQKNLEGFFKKPNAAAEG